ncbi:hypothetical protein DICPUDRAFT_92103 [Dictyostelium purpureum]|uniref:Uncharacterized protein n=1 Tax=Dictyostelium purpureum TaxID=5786 RepID=F0ZM11_DICPU|nr:uncharacterized protein DICPUDRAFT_92103 [Dictyostelium purpureum]EGC35030.1 hypothetical protein DICPUDRAFT_92103 [Dictyostelium purpureum]|eukprot:XP_003288458.1 hypothetical protein DICPUDRAFT_92103 [Dictyostelium purpureum]
MTLEDKNNNNNEEEIVINEDDEYLGILHLNKEQLIDTIREIREEYFELQEDHNKLEERYKDKIKEIEFNRKLLTEREDLLLQLQWDPNQDNSYLMQMGASDTNQANEQKMKAMMDQMRVMERGIFERDEKIKQMEKVIETFTLQQINNGVQPTQIIYPQFNTIRQSASEPNSSFNTPANPSIFNKLSQSTGVQSSNMEAPNTFTPIEKYPLPREATQMFDHQNKESTVSVSTPQTSQPLNRSTSFWQSPSAFFSNLLGRSSSTDVINKDKDQENSNNNEASDDEDYSTIDTKPHVVPLQSHEIPTSSGIRV